MSQDLKKHDGVYPGWWIVVTGFLAMAIIFPAGLALMSVLIGPIAESFGVPTSTVSIQFSMITLFSMFGSMTSGYFFDKFGMKKTMLASTLIAIIGFLALAFSPTIYLNYVIAAIMGFALPLVTNVGISVIVNVWFGKKLAGNAVGIAMTGSGFGAMILTPVMTQIIENFEASWRAGYIFLAILSTLIVLPFVIFAIKESPEAEGIQKIGTGSPDGESGGSSVKEDSNYGITLSKAKSTAAFYITAFIIIVGSLVGLIFFTIAYEYFVETGFSPEFASILLSVQAAAVIVGKYFMGALSDRTNAFVSTFIVAAFMLAGVLCIMLVNGSQVLAIIAMLLFGIGNAIGTISVPTLTQDVFGNVNYSKIVGLMTTFAGLGAAVGPILTSTILDLSGSFMVPWSVAAGALILALILTVVLSRISKNMEEQRLPSNNQ